MHLLIVACWQKRKSLIDNLCAKICYCHALTRKHSATFLLLFIYMVTCAREFVGLQITIAIVCLFACVCNDNENGERYLNHKITKLKLAYFFIILSGHILTPQKLLKLKRF